MNKKVCILPDGQLWEWLTGRVALPQPKCNWSVGFAIARRHVGKASDNARIMLSIAYSDIAWCKQFLPWKVFIGYFLPTKHHIVYWLIIPSISKKLTLKKLGWHFRAKFLDASNIYQFRNWNTFILYRSNIFDKGSHWGPGKFVTFHWRLFKIHVLLYQSDSYPKFPRAPVY